VLGVGACTGAAASPSESGPSIEPSAESSASLEQPSPDFSPTALARPSDTPEPSVTPTPIPVPPSALTRLKTIDASKYRITALPDHTGAYWWDPLSKGAALFYDVNGSRGSVPIPLTKAESAEISDRSGLSLVRHWFLGAGAHAVAILAAHIIEPSEPGTPCGAEPTEGWRILVAPLDQTGKPGAFSVLAAGTSDVFLFGPGIYPHEGSDCAHLDWPQVAISGDLIAYTIQAPTGAAPSASQIIVRSLVDGTIVRQISVPEAVLQLQLSDHTLTWMQFSGDINFDTSFPLMISTADNPDPKTVMTFEALPTTDAFTPPTVLLVGSLLAWDGYSTGKVWMRDLANTTPQQISPAGAYCRLQAFDGTHAAMNCAGNWFDPDWVGWDDPDQPAITWPVLWSEQAGSRLIGGLPHPGSWMDMAIQGGQLEITDRGEDGDRYFVIGLN
jgi:hypothetical protein